MFAPLLVIQPPLAIDSSPKIVPAVFWSDFPIAFEARAVWGGGPGGVMSSGSRENFQMAGPAGI